MKRLLLVLMALCSGSALAAGTSVDLQSARATGMASALTAQVDDPSAVYFNPAGLAQGEGWQAQIGDTLLIPHFTFTDPSGKKTNAKLIPVAPFHAYGSYGINKDLSVGLGIYSPFGLSLTWPEGWDGSTLITHASLQTIFFNPSVAYRLLNNRLRVGVGVSLVRATVALEKDLQQGIIQTHLGAGTWAFNANAGVQYDVLPEKLKVGLAWRSRSNLNFTGFATFTGTTRDDEKASARIDLPHSVTAAIAVAPIKKLEIAVESEFMSWRVFDKLAIRAEDGTLLDYQQKNWKNTVLVRAGGEYQVNEQWTARAGLMFDPSPIPDNTVTPELPDTSRVNFAVGAGYHICNAQIDLGYQYILFTSRNTTAPALPGKYNAGAHGISLTLGYRM